LIRHTLRGVDAIGRIGGEEFAVVLPQTDREHALEVAARLCKLTDEAELVLDQGLPLHFTVSIGVATLAGPASTSTRCSVRPIKLSTKPRTPAAIGPASTKAGMAHAELPRALNACLREPKAHLDRPLEAENACAQKSPRSAP